MRVQSRSCHRGLASLSLTRSKIGGHILAPMSSQLCPVFGTGVAAQVNCGRSRERRANEAFPPIAACFALRPICVPPARQSTASYSPSRLALQLSSASDLSGSATPAHSSYLSTLPPRFCHPPPASIAFLSCQSSRLLQPEWQCRPCSPLLLHASACSAMLLFPPTHLHRAADRNSEPLILTLSLIPLSSACYHRPIPNWFRMKADNKIQYNAKRRHWRRTKLNI